MRWLKALLSKTMTVFFYVLKNPIKSVFWCIKFYLCTVLFFVSLTFLFGNVANAQTAGDPPAKPQTVTICKGWSGTSPNPPTFTLEGKVLSSDCSIASHRRYEGEYMQWYNARQGDPCPDPVVSRSTYGWEIQPMIFSDAAKVCAPYGSPKGMGVGSEVVKWVDSVACPPEGANYADYTQMYEKDGKSYCAIDPKKDPNGCFRGTNTPVAPLKHFDHTTTAVDICVTMDNGKKCPFVRGSVPGVYTPNTRSPEKCNETPAPPDNNAQPPEKCVTGGNGMQVCPSNPNEQCTKTDIGSQTAMKCKASCGYMNGKFLCYELPEGTKPDLDDPTAPTDTITDPLKKTADMAKADFKEVQKGVESRLDALITYAKNSQTLAENDNSGKQLDETKWGNELLKAIEDNTGGTLAELKKLNGGDGQGSDFGEYDGKTNDWAKKNFKTVLQDAIEKFKNNSIVSAVKDFFTISVGGSCPVWSVQAWVFEITIDQFCSPVMTSIIPFIRAALLLAFGFLSFRVAFE